MQRVLHHDYRLRVLAATCVVLAMASVSHLALTQKFPVSIQRLAANPFPIGATPILVLFFCAYVLFHHFARGTPAAEAFAAAIQDAGIEKSLSNQFDEPPKGWTRMQEALSKMAHELRTPLTAIYLFISNVSDGLLGDVPPEQRAQLLLALENVGQMKGMIADMLLGTLDDVSVATSYEAAPIVDPGRVSALAMISDAVECCRQSAESKSLQLRSAGSAALPCAWADARRVHQILTNLIDNAIRFTRVGGAIQVAVQASTENPSMLEFSVTDTGCGLTREQSGTIFQRAVRLEASAGSEGRLGLGLFIASDLVAQHGGRIWLESEVGRGSKFFFTLPAFSLQGRCIDVLTEGNLEQGAVTLMALAVAVQPGSGAIGLRSHITPALERVLEPGRDVLLPWMHAGSRMALSQTKMTAFMLACTDAEGAAGLARQIGLELRHLGEAARWEPVFSTVTLQVASFGSIERVSQIVQQFEHFIQEHLQGKEILQ